MSFHLRETDPQMADDLFCLTMEEKEKKNQNQKSRFIHASSEMSHAVHLKRDFKVYFG